MKPTKQFSPKTLTLETLKLFESMILNSIMHEWDHSRTIELNNLDSAIELYNYLESKKYNVSTYNTYDHTYIVKIKP